MARDAVISAVKQCVYLSEPAVFAAPMPCDRQVIFVAQKYNLLHKFCKPEHNIHEVINVKVICKNRLKTK